MLRTTSRGDYSDTFQNPSKRASRNPLRIVGIDGGIVPVAREGGTILVAVLLHGPRIVELRLGKIRVDGRDAQRVVPSLLTSLAYDVVMLSGISFAGFNVVNIKLLARKIRKPVVVVIREKPDNKAVRAALRKHFDDWRERWNAVRAAGRIYSCKPITDEPKLYFEVSGWSPASARQAIVSSSLISRLPEPVRVAGILSKGGWP